MKLYLIRHGEYIDADKDPQKSLSNFGKSEIQKIANYLKSKNATPTEIWHSNKKRSIQSAEIFSQTLNIKNSIEKRGVAPLDNAAHIIPNIEALDTNILLTGHLPSLSNIASTLLSGRPNTHTFPLKTAQCLCLEKDTNGIWQLLWDISPQQL